MAGGDFKRTIFGLILFVLFTSLILTVAINFGNFYGKSPENIGGGSFNLSDYERTIEDSNATGQSYLERFSEATPEKTTEVENPAGAWSILFDLKNVITTPFRLVQQILTNVIHIPSIVSGVLVFLLSLSIAFGIWRLWKRGE